jgi:hypothetical protein
MIIRRIFIIFVQLIIKNAVGETGAFIVVPHDYVLRIMRYVASC